MAKYKNKMIHQGKSKSYGKTPRVTGGKVVKVKAGASNPPNRKARK